MSDDFDEIESDWDPVEISLLGPLVLIERTLYTGDKVFERVPITIAKCMMESDPLNGTEVVAAKIHWNDEAVAWWGGPL